NRTNTYFVVVTNNCDLIAALQFVHRFLRNHHGTFLHVSDETHFSELPGPQNISGIWKRHFIANRASLRIQAAIECIEFTFLRIRLTVPENQFELKAFYVRVALLWIGMSRNEIREWAFAGGDDGFDRIDL